MKTEQTRKNIFTYRMPIYFSYLQSLISNIAVNLKTLSRKRRATNLTRLIRIYIHSSTASVITFKVATKIQYSGSNTSTNGQRKGHSLRFNARDILYDTEESSIACPRSIKYKIKELVQKKITDLS